MTVGFQQAKANIATIIELIDQVQETSMGIAEAAAFRECFGDLDDLRDTLNSGLGLLNNQGDEIVAWTFGQTEGLGAA